MNTYRAIDDAIYEVTNGAIVRQKKSLLIPALVMIFGVLITVFSDRIDIFFPSVDLDAALMLSGVILAIAGLVNLIIDATHKTGVPVLAETGEKLQRYQLFYDTNKKNELCDCIENADFNRMARIPKGSVSSVIVTVYSTKSGSLALAQVAEFVPHQFVPVTNIKVCRGAEGESVRDYIAKVA